MVYLEQMRTKNMTVSKTTASWKKISMKLAQLYCGNYDESGV